ATGLGARQLDSVEQVNRRFWLVGLFNRSKSKHLYCWGPKERMERLRAALDGNPNYHFPQSNDFGSFLDEVEPLVQERLLKTQGQTAVSVQVPPDARDEQYTSHLINQYFLLYEGTTLPGGGSGQPTGQRLLQQIEKDVDSYLDVLRDFG